VILQHIFVYFSRKVTNFKASLLLKMANLYLHLLSEKASNHCIITFSLFSEQRNVQSLAASHDLIFAAKNLEKLEYESGRFCSWHILVLNLDGSTAAVIQAGWSPNLLYSEVCIA